MVTNSFVIVAGSLKLFRYQYLKDKLIRPVSDKKTSNFSEIVTTDSRHDLEIWNTFRLGDKGAYAGIYEGHFDALYAYGRKFILYETQVEDAIQDLFINRR